MRCPQDAGACPGIGCPQDTAPHPGDTPFPQDARPPSQDANSHFQTDPNGPSRRKQPRARPHVRSLYILFFYSFLLTLYNTRSSFFLSLPAQKNWAGSADESNCALTLCSHALPDCSCLQESGEESGTLSPRRLAHRGPSLRSPHLAPTCNHDPPAAAQRALRGAATSPGPRGACHLESLSSQLTRPPRV